MASTKPTYNDDVGFPDIHYNPLQNYRNMTYNTRLSMMPETETKQDRLSRSYDYKKGIILWETGGSGTVYLEELQIQVAGTRTKTGNYFTQTPTSFSGRVVEPIGGRLIEELSLAAMKSGYPTNGVAIYLLEVWFTGYNTDSDMPEVCKGWEGEELVFRWYIRLDELHMKLDYKGAVYDFKATPNDGAAVLNDHYTLEEGFRMSDGPGTIQEFCTYLAKALNEREKEKVKTGLRCIPHKYVISAHKDIKNLKFTYSFWDKVTQFFSMGMGEIQSNSGQTIQQFITGAMPNSQDLLKFLHRIPEKKEYNATETNPDTIHLPMKTLAIIPGCKDIAYDEKLGHTAKEVHYFLTTREDAGAIVSPQEYKDSQIPGNRDKRVNNWVKKGLLRKVYKWIYTGENVEVINTEIKIDNMWRSVRPLWIDKDGKPVQGPSTTSIPSKLQGGKQNSKAVTCAESQMVNAAPAASKGSYTEDLLYRPTAPKEGWHPTQPQFYHMNTTVQQGSSQGALAPENAQEYSIYRQIANGMGGGNGELVNMTLEVVGDPYWLCQIPGTPDKPQPWEDDVWEYEKSQLTEETMAEKRKRASTHTWIGALYFEAQVPSSDVDGQDLMAIRRSDAITGIFWPTTITNRFLKGKFTTKLETYKDNLSNPNKTNSNTNAPNTKSGGGSASSAGPQTAAPSNGRP